MQWWYQEFSGKPRTCTHADVLTCTSQLFLQLPAFTVKQSSEINSRTLTKCADRKLFGGCNTEGGWIPSCDGIQPPSVLHLTQWGYAYNCTVEILCPGAWVCVLPACLSNTDMKTSDVDITWYVNRITNCPCNRPFYYFYYFHVL